MWHLCQLDDFFTEIHRVVVEEGLDELANGSMLHSLLNRNEQDSNVDSSKVSEDCFIEAALLCVTLTTEHIPSQTVE